MFSFSESTWQAADSNHLCFFLYIFLNICSSSTSCCVLVLSLCGISFFMASVFLLPKAEISFVSQGGGHILHGPPESCPRSVDFELGSSSLGLGLTSLWGPAACRVLRGGSVASDSFWYPLWLGPWSPQPQPPHTLLLWQDCRGASQLPVLSPQRVWCECLLS